MRQLAIIGILLLSMSLCSAQIVSTFNSNAEGWTTPDDADGTISYSATGGNPGGLVSGSPFVIVLGATTFYVPFYFTAPTTYLGNRSSYYNGTLRYDIQQSTTGAPNQYAEVIIANSLGITLYYFPPVSNQPPAAPAWATYSVTLNNALGYWKTTNSVSGAAATEAQVLNVLTDLANLQIRGLYRDANTTNRLDNVSMRPPIVITTQPNASTVCEGVTTSLTTAASGNPSITYQWQLESSPSVWTNVVNGGGYSGATLTTLTINTTGNFGAGNYRCRVSGLAVDDAFTSTATVVINALPTAPTTTGAASCSPAALVLTASGASAGQFRWYTVASGGTAIAGQTNATFTTPLISSTTTYYAAINNGTCESIRTAVIATINTPPAAPTTTGAALCGSGSVTLTASGGTAGQYRWYTVATGGTALAGETNTSYTTPTLTGTTTYYVAINNGTCESSRTAVVATINTPPTPPTTMDGSTCGPGVVTLTATGGVNGQYRWYTVSTGGSPLAGEVNATYTTPALTATTTYFVSIHDGTCESSRTTAVATVATRPGKPVITSSIAPIGNSITICSTTTLTLSAPAGFTGYLWSTGATTQQITVSASGAYSVSTSAFPGCNSPASDPLNIMVVSAPCTNTPPVINPDQVSTIVGGQVSIDLLDLISDADDNLVLSTLAIAQPPTSGAPAQLVNNFLEIDYTGLTFTGTDFITIEVCDLFYECTQQILEVEVVGEIEIYNAISANGDTQNPIFEIRYIDLLPDTQQNKVTIYNRWGTIVFEVDNYNPANAFRGISSDGQELPSGTYFYRISFNNGRIPITGYLSLKR